MLDHTGMTAVAELPAATDVRVPRVKEPVPPPEPAAKPQPLWQKISGLNPATEHLLTRAQRREALLKLFNHYETQARAALAEDQDRFGDFKERTYLWDPLPMLCAEMGIARRKLSAYTKELTGMAAHEVIDKIRAEGLPEKIEAALAEEIKFAGLAGSLRLKGNWEWTLYRGIKDLRRSPRYDKEMRAIALGFPNYARMRRGCMLANKACPPNILESKAIDKFAPYFAAVNGLVRRRVCWLHETEGAPYDANVDKKSPCDAIDEFDADGNCLPYRNAWVDAQTQHPEWLAQMRALLGLAPELKEFAK